MIFVITSTLILGLIFLIYYFFSKKIPIPHGLKEVPIEKGLPFIGVANELKPNLVLYMKRLSEKHGPIFRFKIGMREILVLNNFDVIKKTLKDNGDNFSGRPTMKFTDIVNRGSGILFTHKEIWAKQRSFVLNVLRDFGLGKSKSIEIVQSECLYMLEELEKWNGKPLDFSIFIPTYTANVISKFIMNKRYSGSDPRLQVIDRIMTSILKKKDYVQLLFMMFPCLDYNELVSKIILTVTLTWSSFDEAHEIFQKEIDEHSEKLDLNSEGDDLIDRFLIKQHQLKQKTGNEDTFTNWQLIRSVFELLVAGYETTSTTLGWAFMFMSKYPEVQNKVYEEINDEIGQERLPTMNDKKSLNYTQAVMDEIMRISSVVPLAITHINLADASLNGYFIPKNSFIFPNLYACHYDPEVWDNPTEFNPNRFLSMDDEKKLKYCPREELIPFGIGKRQCLGESLAKMEYFIFFASIIQKFKVSFKEKLSEQKYQEVLQGNEGFIRSSLKSDFIFQRRLLE